MVLRIERQTVRGWAKVGEVNGTGKHGFIRFSDENSGEGLIFGQTHDASRSLIYQTNIEEGMWLLYKQQGKSGEIEGLEPLHELLPGQELILPTKEKELPLEFRYRFTHIDGSGNDH